MSDLFKPSHIDEFPVSALSSVRYLFSDLDDTITTHGRLLPETYQTICDLESAGIKVVIVTGSSAGWCNCIARMWPIYAVIGEGGAFYMLSHGVNKPLMTREFVPSKERDDFLAYLAVTRNDLLRKFPWLSLSSDQFARVYDIAVELESVFSQQSKAHPELLFEVVDYLQSKGLNTKVSSIHINATLGSWDKLTSTKALTSEQLGMELTDILEESAFIGDSLNDEVMFGFFKYSIGVANVRKYKTTLNCAPKWITNGERGVGFAEFAQLLLKGQFRN